MKSVIISALILSFLGGRCQSIRPQDPIFPSRGHSNIGLITTYNTIAPPPALILDVTYGFTDGFAMGLSGGTTGALALYGLKFNVSFLTTERMRIHMRNMIVYYPERKGSFLFDREWKYSMPWMLTMTVIEGEWHSQHNFRYSLGFGLMEDHCIEQMKIWLGRSKNKHGLFEWYQDVHASVSMPLGKNLIVRPEVIVVMQNGKLIESQTHKIAFPVNPFLNVIYAF